MLDACISYNGFRNALRQITKGMDPRRDSEFILQANVLKYISNLESLHILKSVISSDITIGVCVLNMWLLIWSIKVGMSEGGKRLRKLNCQSARGVFSDWSDGKGGVVCWLQWGKWQG